VCAFELAARRTMAEAFSKFRSQDQGDPTSESVLISGVKVAMEIGLSRQAVEILEDLLESYETDVGLFQGLGSL